MNDLQLHEQFKKMERQKMPYGEWFTHGAGLTNRVINYLHVDSVVKIDRKGFMVSRRDPTEEEIEQYCDSKII